MLHVVGVVRHLLDHLLQEVVTGEDRVEAALVVVDLEASLSFNSLGELRLK